MFEVTGYSFYDFVDKETQAKVQGVSLCLLSEGDGKKFFGRNATKISISEAKMESVMGDLSLNDLIGQRIDVLYNRFGKAEKIMLSK